MTDAITINVELPAEHVAELDQAVADAVRTRGGDAERAIGAFVAFVMDDEEMATDLLYQLLVAYFVKAESAAKPISRE